MLSWFKRKPPETKPAQIIESVTRPKTDLYWEVVPIGAAESIVRFYSRKGGFIEEHQVVSDNTAQHDVFVHKLINDKANSFAEGVWR